jgi:N-acetylmuramoyl-L-alanine amidase
MAAASAEIAVRARSTAPDASPPVIAMAHEGAPKRRGIIPRWLPWSIGGAVLVVIVVVGLVAIFAREGRVRVPSLTGLDQATAKTKLTEVGLKFAIGDHRFSANAPVGTVLGQDPVPGTQVSEGAVVTVAVSGGSEVFSLPDVTGLLLDAARAKLKDRGLVVEYSTSPSDKDQGTVLSSLPAPGQQVETGDTIRLTIAAGASGTDITLPSDLTGLTFVLDPAPMPASSAADTTFDVTRRVRALLEASGARVVLTRTATAKGDAAGTLARSRKARETTATALVGFGVTQSGVGGLAVASVPNTSTTQALYAQSLALAQAVSDQLKAAFSNVTATSATNDTILTDTGVPAVRVRLGSSAASADALSFSDPQWADNVARAVYRAIAQTYGKK